MRFAAVPVLFVAAGIVVLVALIARSWAVDERGAVIALCDGPSRPWSELWPDLRRFY